MKKIILRFLIIVLLISVLFLLDKGFNILKKETPPPKISESVLKPIQNGQIVLAAGDIECTGRNSEATRTARLLDSLPGTILTLGDNVQRWGLKEEFDTCFDLTWGKYKDRIFPSVGDHEYQTEKAKFYYEYFGKRAGDPGRGYYSFNLGNWHLVAVNTIIFGREYLCPKHERMCDGVEEQWEWLKKDLQKNKTDCTLVLGHYPLFSSVATLSTTQMVSLWELLYSEGVDVILNGHAHLYERFAPQTPEGKLDTKRGVREFVVGTGGVELTGVKIPLADNSEVVNQSKHGVLRMVLGVGEYEWEFLSTDGSYVDKGTGVCH